LFLQGAQMMLWVEAWLFHPAPVFLQAPVLWSLRQQHRYRQVYLGQPLFAQGIHRLVTQALYGYRLDPLLVVVADR